PLEIAAICSQRVGRRTAFRRKHREEILNRAHAAASFPEAGKSSQIIGSSGPPLPYRKRCGRSSSSRDGLSRNHPGFSVQTHCIERADDVEKLARRHLVPTGTLHAK